MSIYPAHIRNVDGKSYVQTVEEHCWNVAQKAAELLKDIGLEKTAYLAGLTHDLGKNTYAFKAYIEKAAAGEKVQRGSVNHTFAGARFFLEQHNPEAPAAYRDIALEILAYAVGAHHGLFDCIDEEKRNGFTKRLQKENIDYEHAVKEFLNFCVTREKIDVLLNDAEIEIKKAIENTVIMAEHPKAEIFETQGRFYSGFLARLLLSAVIEPDRSDTISFMNGISENKFKNMPEIWADCIEKVEKKLETLPKDNQLQKVRSEISDLCAEAGKLESGIYRLNLPTGAGKTLTSLRYALHHALKHNKKRIFFVMPLLSIIEQNAGVIHDYLQNEDLILEHHSNVVETKEDGELDERELLTESWNAPIIITTLVQLLNTLFAGKPTSIRRMQALCNSIIVLDEVQSVPNKMLSLFNLALNFLAKICNATVILCSATQPSFETTSYSLNSVKDLINLTDEQLQVFKRVKLVDAGTFTAEELTEFAAEILQENSSLLVVCNTKSETAKIFNLINNNIKDVKVFHISAGMCMAHRKNVIEKLQKALEESKKNPKNRVVCVSTQVIEAGVDVSFAIAIRLLAGLDNIVQATGRENRNREFDGLAPGYIVRLKGEKLRGLSEIEAAKNAADDLLKRFKNKPEAYDNDLMSDKAVKEYYKCLYANVNNGYHDFYVESVRDSILNLLSGNKKFCFNAQECNKYFLHQAFKTAGGLFAVFDESSIEVIVPHEEGKNIICELMAIHKCASKEMRSLLQKAKLYTVSLFLWQKNLLEQQGALVYLENAGVYILMDGYYDELTGLNVNQSELPLQII